jgi:hypothetical protein
VNAKAIAHLAGSGIRESVAGRQARVDGCKRLELVDVLLKTRDKIHSQ